MMMMRERIKRDLLRVGVGDRVSFIFVLHRYSSLFDTT